MKHHWSQRTLRQVVSLLEQALQPSLEVHFPEPGVRTGLSKSLQGPPLVRLKNERGRIITLSLEPWNARATPRREHQPLWVLQRATRRVHDQLRRRDESFVDVAGVVRIHVPGLLVDRNDLRPPSAPAAYAPEVRNPYSDTGSLVVRALFAGGTQRPWTVQELARTSGASLATTSYVVRALSYAHLVEPSPDEKGRIRLKDPRLLVQDWTRHYDWTMNHRIAFHAPIGSPARFLPRLKEPLAERTWALTLHAGASLVAKHATWDQIHCYVDVPSLDAIRDLGRSNGWEPARDGKLVIMRPYYRRAVWRDLRTIQDLPVVSDLQLILDLWHYPVRGLEQAEYLLDLVAPSAAQSTALD